MLELAQTEVYVKDGELLPYTVGITVIVLIIVVLGFWGFTWFLSKEKRKSEAFKARYKDDSASRDA